MVTGPLEAIPRRPEMKRDIVIVKHFILVLLHIVFFYPIKSFCVVYIPIICRSMSQTSANGEFIQFINNKSLAILKDLYIHSIIIYYV